MALWIQNVTPDDRPDTEPHEYLVKVNHKVLASFRHVRAEGAAECFRRAAEALDAKEQS